MPVVKLHGTLRRYFDNYRQPVEGKTVGQALEALGRQNEAFRAVIFDGAGLNPHLRFFVRGRDIELWQGLDTELAETDELAIFEPVSGG
jgi:molybdopterin converting factor small subunit